MHLSLTSRNRKLLGVCLAVLITSAVPLSAQNDTAKVSRLKRRPHSHIEEAQLHQSPQAAPQEIVETLVQREKQALATADPEKIKSANVRLIAAALRSMAELRMVEGAFLQAAALYKQAYELQDAPSEHLKYGNALLRISNFPEALAESKEAIAIDPNDDAAWYLAGEAQVGADNYTGAAQAFARSLKLAPNAEKAYALATCYLNLHEDAKARLVFDDMAKHYGRSGALEVLIGRAYRDSGDLKEAAVHLKRALEIDPKTPHANYFLALLNLLNDEWRPSADTMAHLNAELRIAPNDFLANYLTGVMDMRVEQKDAAEHYLRRAQEIDPTTPDPPLYLGMIAFDRGDYATAEPLFREAIRLTGSDQSRNFFQLRKAYLDLGRILARKGDNIGAEEAFAKARELQQENLKLSQQAIAGVMGPAGNADISAVVPLMKKTEVGQGGDVGPSEPTARLSEEFISRTKLTVAQRAQADAEEKSLRSVLGAAYNDFGTAQAREQQFEPALLAFEQAEKWAPQTPNVERNLGAAAMKLAKFPEAAQALSKHIAQNPQDQVTRAMLVAARFMTADFVGVVQAAMPLGDQAASDPRVGYMVAESLAKTGDAAGATELLKKLQSLSMSPDEWLLVGQTYSELRRFDDAIAAFHQASEERPVLAKAHYYAGLAYLNSDRPVQAADEFQRELALSPNDIDAKYNLAYVLIQQSHTDEATKLLQQVLVAAPNHAEAHYQLGKLMLDAGNTSGAIAQLESAAKLAPEKDFIHYQLQVAYRKAQRNDDANRELEIYKQAKARDREHDAVRPQ